MRAVLTTASMLSCLLALAASGWAEEDAGAGAERLAHLRRDLRSDNDATVAHAAYAASEAGLRDLTLDLIRTLAARPKPEGREAWLVVAHLLDALIRLDARVSNLLGTCFPTAFLMRGAMWIPMPTIQRSSS